MSNGAGINLFMADRDGRGWIAFVAIVIVLLAGVAVVAGILSGTTAPDPTIRYAEECIERDGTWTSTPTRWACTQTGR